MIDVKQPVRKAYFDLLFAQLLYNGNPIPVVDDVKNLGDSSTVYVVLSNQDGVNVGTFQSFDSTEKITLDIVYKAQSRVNKEVVDSIAGQLFQLVLPAPNVTGLASPPGTQINCVEISDDRYMPTMFNGSNTVVRRLVTFKQHVRQTGSPSGIPAPAQPFSNPITSVDFSNATDYANAAFNNRKITLYLNGVGFLTEGTQWQPLSGGGFKILMPNFDATRNAYVFYLLLT
jgi:hypothetical protein